jgi:hypothetical protein
MDSNAPFNHYHRVESLARPVPSTYKLDKGTDRYVHIVAFNDPKDHEQMIRDYLEDYCKVDPDSSDSILRGLKTDHRMCAHAILTYYLRTEIIGESKLRGPLRSMMIFLRTRQFSKRIRALYG